MSTFEKESKEPQKPITNSSQTQQQPSQSEEKIDSEEELKSYKFLCVRQSTVPESNGTYALFGRGNMLWTKDEYLIAWDPIDKNWKLLSPDGEVIGETIDKLASEIPPIDMKWCVRQEGSSSYVESAMDVSDRLDYKEGEEVFAKFGKKWYAATIFRVHKDDTVDVWWHDQRRSKTSYLPFGSLRKRRYISAKLKFDNFESITRVARLKIPISWKIKKLRELIGCKTITNFEAISIYHGNNEALALNSTIEELRLSSGVCLTAKKEIKDHGLKSDPEGMWCEGDDCEVCCYDDQWRMGKVTRVFKDKRGQMAEVCIQEKKNTIHVSKWHKLLRPPGVGMQAPLPQATCMLPAWRVGDKVTVKISDSEKKEAKISSILNGGTQWRVTFDGEEKEDVEVYNLNDFERKRTQQNQVMQADIRPDYFGNSNGSYNRIFKIIERIHECKDPESLEQVIGDIFMKFPEEKDDDANARLFTVLKRFERQIDSKSLFPIKGELCIHLAELLPKYLMSEISVTLPFDEGMFSPIPNPESNGGEDKYLTGAQLSKNIIWDEGASQDINIPLGSRLIQVDYEIVDGLTHEEILHIFGDVQEKGKTYDFIFNIGGTEDWVLRSKVLRVDERESAPGPVPRFHRNSLTAEETFQVNDIVYFLDGDKVKTANVVQFQGNNTYCIIFIEKDEMDPPRNVHASLLSKNPADLKRPQLQSQTKQQTITRQTIVDTIVQELERFHTIWNSSFQMPVQDMHDRLKRKYPDSNINVLLGSTLESFLEKSDRYVYEVSHEGTGPTHMVRLNPLYSQRMQELKKEDLCGPKQQPESKEISEEKTANIRALCNSICIYPSEEQLRLALRLHHDIDSQVNYLCTVV